jgi:two-component system, chemotaxis family, protein-glutamate methylesterase/glutaminase
MPKIRALVIDDSALVRQVLTEILNSDQSIEVVGTAADPYIAREKIKKLNPDVLTLDVEMPRMDGITFLRNLMRLRPMPVLMVSSLTERGADVTLQALELGAVDFVSKPKVDLAHGLDEYSEEIIEKVKVAAKARIQGKPPVATPITILPKLSADAVLESHKTMHLRTTDRIVAIGASTGGTEAIKDILARMPADAPGIVITQHMPEAFTASFAQRMDSLSSMIVREAKDGDQIIPGHAFIAPGNHHLLVTRSGARYLCRLNEGPPVNRHRPSVDVLFRSVADNVGPNGVGVILTGMGDDGAQGMMEMHDVGIPTLAQDERTSVVWGMPGSAVKLGAVDEILPLERITAKILAVIAGNKK